MSSFPTQGFLAKEIEKAARQVHTNAIARRVQLGNLQARIQERMNDLPPGDEPTFLSWIHDTIEEVKKRI